MEINATTDFVLQNFILNKNSLYSHNMFNLEQCNKNMNLRILRKQIDTNWALFCTFSFQTLLRHPQQQQQWNICRIASNFLITKHQNLTGISNRIHASRNGLGKYYIRYIYVYKYSWTRMSMSFYHTQKHIYAMFN